MSLFKMWHFKSGRTGIIIIKNTVIGSTKKKKLVFCVEEISKNMEMDKDFRPGGVRAQQTGCEWNRVREPVCGC